jgi:hypothetical protein
VSELRELRCSNHVLFDPSQLAFNWVRFSGFVALLNVWMTFQAGNISMALLRVCPMRQN